MATLTLEHFRRAASEIAAHGDNDTLPFDVDTRFIAASKDELAEIAFAFGAEIERGTRAEARGAIDSLSIFAERLLVPTGAAGFRISTKIHPFWTVYFNGLGIAVAELHEPTRSSRAHAYRFVAAGDSLFDKAASWRAFREASVAECRELGDSAVVVQTDISSFYEYVSHHRLENAVADLLPKDSTLPSQIDRFLSKFAAGRSFGLPVGGQCSRILAEVLLSSVDNRLSDAKVIWRRFVDDYVLIASSQAEAYSALSVLSHALANYGLALSRAKTTLLSAGHYIDYIQSQLGSSNDAAGQLREIDLHFDPYSDSSETDYEELKSIIEGLEIRILLDAELRKGQPDSFLMTQIARTLRLHDPQAALQLCSTLLAGENLHAFRASWSTIMRGVTAVRGDDNFAAIFSGLDGLLDRIPGHSPHLLLAEASCIHYLKTIRFRRTPLRAQFVFKVYSESKSETVKRACMDCWRGWNDRASFTSLRNRWETLSAEEQRMLWLAAAKFGDEGEKFRSQVKSSLPHAWRLGIERKKNNEKTFASLYADWAVKSE